MFGLLDVIQSGSGGFESFEEAPKHFMVLDCAFSLKFMDGLMKINARGAAVVD